jgi:NADPH:quinone reductase-like Zn-dependent oxidoreductase/aryl carrier-like protein
LLHGPETANHLRDWQLVTTDKNEPHDAVVFTVQAETLSDVERCAETARTLVATGSCWVVALSAKFVQAAAAAAVEVGAQAVIGTLDDVRSVHTGLGLNAPLVLAQNGKLEVEAFESAPQTTPAAAGPMDAFSVTTDPSQGAKGAKCNWSKRREPASHEVELKTSVWALNFRDVLVAVGAIPSTVAGQSLGIGGECYGEVVRVGASVEGLAIGDRVIGCPPDGMGSFTTFDARWVGHAPPSMTPDHAVSGTAVYATAWLGLYWMANVSKGDRVLIHSAAGGVGLSAVHLCLRRGCTVYVTASTQEKRAMLLSLGAAAAFDSRNPAAFEEGVLEATDGKGIDVVLNSLSGEAIPASLRLLCPFGRFIEIGKRDQYEDTRIGLAPFLNGLTYAAAHLDVLMLKQPERCRKLLCEVWEALPDLPALPTTSFDINELPKALEYFSKGIHIGKVLVAIGDDTLVHATQPSAILGPPSDAVTQALQSKLCIPNAPGGVLCIPALRALEKLETHLADAQVVLTTSRAVADFAGVLAPSALCIQLPKWEPIAGLNAWLGLKGVFLASEEEKTGNLEAWLMEVVGEMAGSIGMEQTFESAGLDSLSLISLARRLTSKVGKSVSVVDLYDHPTPQQLLNALSGGPQVQISRSKAVVLHGYRTNRDIMNWACSPIVSALGSVDWLFLNAPIPARGPGDPNIPGDMEVFEWYGKDGGSYETGWMNPHTDGIDKSLAVVKALAPVGIVGFSQGGALAALLECAWVALFSPVVPPGVKQRDTPSFHAYDPNEEFVSHCHDMMTFFSNKEVHTHSEGHNMPQSDTVVQAFASWAARQPLR